MRALKNWPAEDDGERPAVRGDEPRLYCSSPRRNIDVSLFLRFHLQDEELLPPIGAGDTGGTADILRRNRGRRRRR